MKQFILHTYQAFQQQSANGATEKLIGESDFSVCDLSGQCPWMIAT
jgi:hypothetical protein